MIKKEQVVKQAPGGGDQREQKEMAESILGFLLNYLANLTTHEANLLQGVEDEVSSLYGELSLMNALLESFEGKGNKLANELVNQLRDIAYEAENIIDTYVAKVRQQRGKKFLWKVKHKCVELAVCHETARKIKSIRKKIDEILTNKDRYNIQISEAGESSMILSQRQRRLPQVDEAEMVGLDCEKEKIINQLIEGGPILHVIPIVGMGGLGKTRLAQMVYDDARVQNHFEILPWIYVSKDYIERELLHAIIKGIMVITDEMKEMKDEDLRMELCNHLRRTKYLIVLDDIWKWDEFYDIFANNCPGSRIILTTRNKDVAYCASANTIDHHYLRFLDARESWDLLQKKVFQGGSVPEDLEELGKKIVEKCGGLPLAINVLAGVLKLKENRHCWWPKVLSRVSYYLTEKKEQCMDILALSYDDLPDYLRDCFLYFGAFLEHIEIPARQLIQMWIAEKFVKQKHLDKEEDIAHEYLGELIDRNLIQAVKLRRFDEGIKACRIHDVLRQLCILKAKETKFLEVHGNVDLSPTKTRRLAIHSDNLNISLNPSSNLWSSNLWSSNLWSFLCFGSGHLSSKHWKLLCQGFSQLKVLDLWGVVVNCIPSEIAKLILLRFLRLRSSTTQSLPSSICKLRNLQTLEVKAPSLKNHPKIKIWKLKELRHLYFHGKTVVLPAPGNRDDDLSNLQTLSSISPESCTKHILSKFPELIKLGIHGDLKAHMDDQIFNGISVLEKLQTLKLKRDQQWQGLSSLDWVEFPANITKLTLSKIQLSRDPMQKLGMLNKLQVLKLTNGAYMGEVLRCSSAGFPQLKICKFINLGIKEWQIDTGSMGILRIVVISGCSSLQGLPSALGNLSTLQELELWSPNSSVLSHSKNIQKHVGSKLLKLTIKH